MQKVELSEVRNGTASIPADVLHALGAANGDKVAFVKKMDGSISLVKAAHPPADKQPISEIVGVFSTGEQRSLEEELALLREIRYGDELEERAIS